MTMPDRRPLALLPLRCLPLLPDPEPLLEPTTATAAGLASDLDLEEAKKSCPGIQGSNSMFGPFFMPYSGFLSVQSYYVL